MEEKNLDFLRVDPEKFILKRFDLRFYQAGTDRFDLRFYQTWPFSSQIFSGPAVFI